MSSIEILEYLKKHGESMDCDIATAINLPLAKTRALLADLISKTDVIACETIKFEKGNKIEGLSCRVSGFTPKAKPGAKSKVQLKLS
jgi:hypothetical protein